MHSRTQAKAVKSQAYTLLEIIFSLAIFLLITIGLTSFMTQSAKGLFWATNKSEITSDVRLFTTRISNEALSATKGYVYRDFTINNRDDSTDRKDPGETGDCLIFTYTDSYPGLYDPKHFTKLVVYFRRPDNSGIGSVYRAEKELSTPVPIAGTTLEDFVKSHFADASGTYPVVLELSRGLANGQLFRVSSTQTFVINGEILHGNQVKEVTNTYNLTISPRG